MDLPNRSALDKMNTMIRNKQLHPGIQADFSKFRFARSDSSEIIESEKEVSKKDQLYEFFVILYKKIVENHSDGLNKVNLLHQLHQIEPDNESMAQLKQDVMRMSSSSAVGKMRDLLRTKKFNDRVKNNEF